MFGTIRKHQQWLWIVIIVVIIISFVIFFSPDADWSRTGPRQGTVFMIGDKPATINGQPIPLDEYQKAFREVYLAHFMRSGGREWPKNDEATNRELERNAVIRVFLRRKLAEMDIKPSDEAVARATRERLGGLPIANFEKEYLATHGLSLDDFERFMRTEVGIQQLHGVAGVSGRLVNVKDAEDYYRRENEQFVTELAIFTASNYVDKVNVNADDVAKYYSNHMAMYRIPERTVVNFIEMPASNYFNVADESLGKITNLQAMIDETYLKLGTNFFTNATGAALSEKEAKEKIKEEERTRRALMEARRKAAEFGDALYNMAEPNRVENLAQLARERNLEVKTSPPFDRAAGLEETKFPDEFRETALKLTKDAPIAFRPIIGEEAVYLIALKEKVPGELPQLEKIKDKVTTDFKNDKARELARAAGTNFHAAASNALAAGKTFEQASKEANIQTVSVPPFSPGTQTLTNYTEKVPLRSIQQLVIDMEKGKMTDFRPSFDGGYIVFLKDRHPVSDEQMKKELPDFVNRLRRVRQNEALDQWFRKQVDQAKVVIPPHETAPPAGMPPGMPPGVPGAPPAPPPS